MGYQGSGHVYHGDGEWSEALGMRELSRCKRCGQVCFVCKAIIVCPAKGKAQLIFIHGLKTYHIGEAHNRMPSERIQS